MSLDLNPLRGLSRADIRPGVRSLNHEGNRIIVYAVGTNEVEILRIYHGRQDWETRFR